MANWLYVKGYHYISSGGLHLDEEVDPGWSWQLGNNANDNVTLVKNNNNNVILENLSNNQNISGPFKLHLIGVHDIKYYDPSS